MCYTVKGLDLQFSARYAKSKNFRRIASNYMTSAFLWTLNFSKGSSIITTFLLAYRVLWGRGGGGDDQCTLFKIPTMAFTECTAVLPVAAIFRKKRKLVRDGGPTSVLGHVVVRVFHYHDIDDRQ